MVVFALAAKIPDYSSGTTAGSTGALLYLFPGPVSPGEIFRWHCPAAESKAAAPRGELPPAGSISLRAGCPQHYRSVGGLSEGGSLRCACVVRVAGAVGGGEPVRLGARSVSTAHQRQSWRSTLRQSTRRSAGPS